MVIRVTEIPIPVPIQFSFISRFGGSVQDTKNQMRDRKMGMGLELTGAHTDLGLQWVLRTNNTSIFHMRKLRLVKAGSYSGLAVVVGGKLQNQLHTLPVSL